MCRAFQPFTMQGIYFSLKTSFQIKISPFHLRLLQSHHIPREKKPRFAKKHFLLLYKLWRNLKKLYSTITLTIFFCFIKREKKFCFLGSKNRCFCFQGLETTTVDVKSGVELA